MCVCVCMCMCMTQVHTTPLIKGIMDVPFQALGAGVNSTPCPMFAPGQTFGGGQRMGICDYLGSPVPSYKPLHRL